MTTPDASAPSTMGQKAGKRDEQPDDSADAGWASMLFARTWQGTLAIGVVTLILGLVVSFHPAGSITVIAVLLGILMIISGIFHLVRVFDTAEPHRVWLGIAGLAFVVLGIVLIRHLHVTVALIGLIVGIQWVIQGIVAFIAGLSGGPREDRGWWVFFGLVSVIAGIVVVAAPVSSLTVLAVLVGIWFAVIGLLEIAGAFLLRRTGGAARAAMASEPGDMHAEA